MKKQIEETVLKLPSLHQIDDVVTVQWNKQRIKGCIISVKFTDYGKVLYDISISVFKDDSTEIHDVESEFVTKEE